MAIENKKIMPIHDGTSQSERLWPALSPDYVLPDERTTVDLLAFAKGYARELKYFDDNNTNSGLDWSGLFKDSNGNDIDLQAVCDYLQQKLEQKSLEQQDAQQPGFLSAAADKVGDYTRPHFVLLLVFLELLSHSRKQLNKLTHRHLEFFYRDVLRMARKPAMPDRVHVLVDLDRNTHQQRLPVGTELLAGEDDRGEPLIYTTGRELIASQVEVAQLQTLHAQHNITGLRQACPPQLKGSRANRQDAFMSMLCIALGQPNPGDPLPSPIYPGGPAINPDNPVVTFDMVVDALHLLEVADRNLGIALFSDFRLLMDYKRQRHEQNAGDWQGINAILDAAGKKRDASFTLQPSTPDNFEQHLQAALGLTDDAFKKLFDGLPEVTNIEEAYTYRNRDDVDTFITEKLYLSQESFKSMMQIKNRMDNTWEEINRLLETAGQRKRDRSETNNTPFALSPTVRDGQDFSDKLAVVAAEPNHVFDGDIDSYFLALKQVEQYFHTSAENIVYIMSVIGAPNVDGNTEAQASNDEYEWNIVYTILTTAHQEMLYSRRRDQLKQVAQPDTAVVIGDPLQAMIKLLAVVLGTSVSDAAEAINSLKAFRVNENDRKYLHEVIAANQTSGGSQPDWKRVYTILEVAQRNRENYQPRAPEKVEWRGLYPANDATAVIAQSAVDNLSRWKTFGQGEQRRTQEPAPQANFGWAISSPLLTLTEGKRTVTLTLGFSAAVGHFDVDKMLTLFAPNASDLTTAVFNPFEVQFSTAEGWLTATSVQLKWRDAGMTHPLTTDDKDADPLKALIFECTLAEGEPPLSPSVRDMHNMDTPAPAMRLMVKPSWNAADRCYLTSSYSLLRELLLVRAHLKVAVEGLTNLAIANDQSNLDAKKPFEPFGFQPAAGSRFYVGHREIAAKTLDSLTFNIDWMGVPDDLGVHYANYPADDSGNKLNVDSFTAKVCLVEGNVPKNFAGSLQLLNDVPKHFSSLLKYPNAKTSLPTDQGNPDKAVTDSAIVTDWNRYLYWELEGTDFQHTVYPSLALQKSLELSANIANLTPDNVKKYQINPPYTPKVKSLTIDYTATAELDLKAAATDKRPVQCFHIEPFGFAELAQQSISPDSSSSDVPLSGHPLLPQYLFEGELYIGLRNVTAPQNLSLLFQMAEGSADPDLTPQPLQWSYLSGNRWLSLQEEGAILADTTRGLINSGIVEMALKPVQPNTLLADNLYWIRIAIERSAQSVCDIVAIHPNAVMATAAKNQADAVNGADTVYESLPPSSIESPLQAIPGVDKLRQPYSSFGGRGGEQDQHFYVRVGERLRHKGRALTPWDYERLVLEQFPQIYKAKCLRADPLYPGVIRLVVIPDIRNRLPFNPFEPKAPANEIQEIQDFLQNKTPPAARIEVKNARYVPVKVRCSVRFMPDQDENFCRLQLNRELNRFLSPWAYEEGADITIGGSIYANSIINFIDRRDYVDYIAGFTLFAGEQELLVTAAADDEGYRVSADKPDEVLVAAREHIFDTINTADFRVEKFAGINYMKVELDFIVA